jgi:hypothetical protein
MKKCILCGIDTEGSVGAAGICWPMICQKCKDQEDSALLNRLESLKIITELI